jgi:hypothetical protein
VIPRDELHQQLFEEQFKAFCDKWYALLQLCNWKVDFDVTDVVDNDSTIQAQCTVNTALGHKVLVEFAQKMAYEDDQTREELVIHELLHIHLNELGTFALEFIPEGQQPYFTRLIEIATSDLANVLMVLGENIKSVTYHSAA